jgi:hypothetical protein
MTGMQALLIRPVPVSRPRVARSVPEAASTARAREAGPQ